MLKISTSETRNTIQLVLEGKLISPWTSEVRTACECVKRDLNGRELVVVLKNVTVISQEGENLIVALMEEGVHFRCSGAFNKYLLNQLASKRCGRLKSQPAT